MEEQVAGGGKGGLSCTSAPHDLEITTKARRAEGALGTGLAQPWGFSQSCPTVGPPLVLYLFSLGPLLVLLLARPAPGCPQLPPSRAWPFLFPAAALHTVPFPQRLSQISKWCGLCWVLAWGPWGLSKSPPPTHRLCWGQCCISLAGSVHCPSLVSQRNDAAGVTLPWKKPNARVWPCSSVGDGLGKEKTWLPACLSHQTQTRLPVPLHKQELGCGEEIWLMVFRGLCRPCPASADGFLPREKSSTVTQGCTPGFRAPPSRASRRHSGGDRAVPGELGTPPAAAGSPQLAGPAWGPQGRLAPALSKAVSSRV